AALCSAAEDPAHGEGHLRRRLLLGRGGSVPPRGRRRLERRRLLGRSRPEPDLPRRLLRRHRPRRVRAGGVRRGARLLRAAPRRVLGEPRSDPAEPPGPDVGAQYRSAIFFHTRAQEAAARASKARLDASGRFRRPIVTEITPVSTFYRAEEYHQRYLEKRG